MSIQIEKAEPGIYWIVKDNKTIGSIQKEYVNAHWSGENLSRRTKGKYEWAVELGNDRSVVNTLAEAKKIVTS